MMTMLDVLAYALFVILLIGFLRYAMRDLPAGEVFGDATKPPTSHEQRALRARPRPKPVSRTTRKFRAAFMQNP
jgi:hypothetical protein